MYSSVENEKKKQALTVRCLHVMYKPVTVGNCIVPAIYAYMHSVPVIVMAALDFIVCHLHTQIYVPAIHAYLAFCLIHNVTVQFTPILSVIVSNPPSCILITVTVGLHCSCKDKSL